MKDILEITLFIGKHNCKINYRNACKVPNEFRSYVGKDLYIMQGFERNLFCVTDEVFREIVVRMTSNNIADPLVRLLLRMLLSSAHVVRISKQGHIRIPNRLHQFIGKGKNLCIIGQGDYFEIWTEDIWNDQEKLILDSDQNATRFTSLNVNTKNVNAKQTMN